MGHFLCVTLTSQSNPQMRINQGLEIRYEKYEKILSTLWLLLHTSLPLLSIRHRAGLSLLLFSFSRKVSQDMGMQMRWLRRYLAAITFPGFIAASRTMTKPFLPFSILLNESTNTLRGKLGHDKVRMFQQRLNQQK